MKVQEIMTRDVLTIAAAVVSSYGTGTSAERRHRVDAFPSPEALAGRVALVVDTVVDSGATAEKCSRRSASVAS